MSGVPEPPIIRCHEWGAIPPKAKSPLCGRPNKIIIHHTASVAPPVTGGYEADLGQAKAFARELQRFHMFTRGWNDTGNNFTVMRSGIILQGRWGTYDAIRAGRMVVSAHCPGENENPGIEHEHNGTEQMTKAQYEATLWLQAWIADRCKISPTAIYGHNVFFPTSCPANLGGLIPEMRARVATIINYHGRAPKHRPSWLTVKLWLWMEKHH